MAIGNPINSTDEIASRIVSVTATEGQSTFTITGGYRINQISVFRNGVRLGEILDFTAPDGSNVYLVAPCSEGDEVTFQIFDEFSVADAIVSAASTQVIYGDLTVQGTLYAEDSGLPGNVGIQSGGVVVGSGKTLNFLGVGNTFNDRGDVVDIFIDSGAGAGIGTQVRYPDGNPSPFAYIDATVNIDQNINLDTTNSGESDSYIVLTNPNMVVSSGVAVTVGFGKTLVVDVLQIGDL